MGLTIAEINLTRGRIAIAPMPGRQGDLADLVAWRPSLVLTLTTPAERIRHAPDLPAVLAAHDIAWRAFPIADFGTPGPGWPEVSAALHAILAEDGRVLLHCLGGCGRSGMIALRLMVEAGETAAPALLRLRNVRPCAVETEAQMIWASRIT